MDNFDKIQHKRISKEILNQDYTYFDMHYHTTYSDGLLSIPKIVKILRKKNIGIAITDHNEIRGAIEISKYDDIKSIPGIEISTYEGIHILAYFYDIDKLTTFYNSQILPYKKDTFIVNIPIKKLVDILKKYDCIFVAAHPYTVSWMGICDKNNEKYINNKIISSFDGFEVLNGANLKNKNKKAILFSNNYDKTITAGSDGHTRSELGKVLTFVKKKDVDKDIFLNLLKQKEVYVIGKESDMISKVFAQRSKLLIPAKSPLKCTVRSIGLVKNYVVSLI